MKPTVIVLGVDSSIGLAVVRDLGRTGVKVIGIGWQIRAVGLHSGYCAGSVLRERKEDALVDQLKALTETHDARFLLVVGEFHLERALAGSR